MKSYKEIYIDDVNKINCLLLDCACKEECDDLSKIGKYNFYIDFKKIEFKLYAKIDSNLPQCYIFRMDGSKASEYHVSGRKAFQQLQRMSNNAIIDMSTDEYKNVFWNEWDNEKGKPIWNIPVEKPFIYFNMKYNGMRFEHCYGHDVKSSYSWAMKNGEFPDLKGPFRKTEIWNDNSLVQQDEIGFREYEDRLIVVKSGGNAEIIFKKLKQNPFIKYIDKYFKLKENTTGIERQKFKDMLNYVVGYSLRKNPFIYTCILHYARIRIERLVDKDTLYCNTDSLVSKSRRLDIEEQCGNELGNFKLEHKDETFAFKNGAYQWNKTIPSARGISKQWYENGFDILVDKLPNNDFNKYVFDRENMKIIENEYGKIIGDFYEI